MSSSMLSATEVMIRVLCACVSDGYAGQHLTEAGYSLESMAERVRAGEPMPDYHAVIAAVMAHVERHF